MTIINTYKSIWIYEKDTGNYIRVQKDNYVFEWLEPIVKLLPIIKHHVSLIGKKKQGVDYYRYYEEIIKNKKKVRKEWIELSSRIKKNLKRFKINVKNKSILDISGEPGFFAQDLKKTAKYVLVTAFADSVAKAIKQNLNLDSIEYNYQKHNLVNVVKKKKFNLIFSIYSLNFCTDLSKFFSEINKISHKNGYFYSAFVESSRAPLARWQFDDYTFLRLYKKDYLIQKAEENGFRLISKVQTTKFHWAWNINIYQKLLAKLYVKEKFFIKSKKEEFQYNTELLFQKL